MKLLASASQDTSEQLTEPVTALWSQNGSLSSDAQRSSFKLISFGRLCLGARLPPSSAHRSPATRQGIQIGPARYILTLRHLQGEETTLVIAAKGIGRTVDTAAIRITDFGSLVEVQAIFRKRTRKYSGHEKSSRIKDSHTPRLIMRFVVAHETIPPTCYPGLTGPADYLDAPRRAFAV